MILVTDCYCWAVQKNSRPYWQKALDPIRLKEGSEQQILLVVWWVGGFPYPYHPCMVYLPTFGCF